MIEFPPHAPGNEKNPSADEAREKCVEADGGGEVGNTQFRRQSSKEVSAGRPREVELCDTETYPFVLMAAPHKVTTIYLGQMSMTHRS